MTDRDLLEAAARAAGLVDPRPAMGCGIVHGRGRYWNPLQDDGDALRLAVKLGIQVTPGDDGDPYAAVQWWRLPDRLSVDFDRVPVEGGDRAAATRRAIVRAAAAMEPK